jgi:NAD+ synthase (glutamine-hydrolysing)
VVKSLLSQDPVPFIYNNNVGIQNNGKNIFLFDGGTTVYNSDGSIMLTTQPYEEKTVYVEIGGEKQKEVELPALSEEKDTEELYNGLVYGIRKFFDGFKNKNVVIGLSGGIDSAVDACLLVDALGAENVHAINMPSKFNSELTKNAAKILAENLAVDYRVISIQEAVDLTVKQLREAGLEVTDFMIENIQARERGSSLLAAIAPSFGGVFVNNGNKTEIAFGYATLYGDINGAIAPLSDVYKGEVYQLADYINRKHGRELIPQSIIDVVPSAELSENQDVTKGKGDPIIYPYHDKLARAFIEFRRDPEYILDLYMKGKIESELRIENGLVNKCFLTPKKFISDLEEKWTLYKRNYFKVIQGPPGIDVSRRARGYDLREAQNGVHFTQRYFILRDSLLD